MTKIRNVINEVLESKLKTEAPKKYLTKKETAALLRMSLPTIQRLTASGKIKGSRIGRRILYSADEIQEAMKRIETLKYNRS